MNSALRRPPSLIHYLRSPIFIVLERLTMILTEVPEPVRVIVQNEPAIFMKNTLLIVLLVVATALSALFAVQRNKLQEQAALLALTQSRLDEVEARFKEKSEVIENAELQAKKANILQEALNDTSSAAAEKGKQVETLEKSLAAAKTNDSGNLLARIFINPKN